MHHTSVRLNTIMLIALLALLPFVAAGNGLHSVPEPVYYHYTASEGLPSNTVYRVMQDSRGFIWFATNSGVSRFDGQHFENFDMSNGLVDNVVFDLYEDYMGRIWFIPFSCQLCYYIDGRIEPYAHNDKIIERANTMRGPIKNGFSIDTLGNVLLSIKQFGVMSISDEGAFRVYTESPYNQANVVVNAQREHLLVSHQPNKDKRPSMLYISPHGQHTFCEDLPIAPLQIHSIPISDSTLCFSCDGHLLELYSNGTKAIRNNGSTIIGLYADHHNNVWVADMDGGVRAYQHSVINSKPTHNLFADSKISSILHDAEDAYWFTTLYNGVYYIPNINARQYTTHQGLQSDHVSAVHIFHNKIHIGYSNAFMDIIHPSGDIQPLTAPHDVKYAINSFVEDAHGQAIFAIGGGPLVRIENNHCWACTDNGLYIRSLVRCADGSYWLGGGRELVHLSPTGVADKWVTTMKSDIWSMAQDPHGNLWLSSNSGLARYDGNTATRVGAEYNQLSNKAYDMLFLPLDSSLWLATNGHGLLRYDPTRGTLEQILRNDGLRSNTINSMVYTSQGIWVATSQGLSIVHPQKGKQPEVRSFTMANGLPNNELTSIAVQGDTLALGSHNGITLLSISQLLQPIPTPPTYITSIEANGQKRPDLLRDNATGLSHKQNTIGLSFITLSYRNHGHCAYRYRLLNADSTWHHTTTTSCLYSALKPGTYTFQVQGQAPSGQWYPNIASMTFTINAPFWQKAWFALLITALLVALAYAFYKVRLSIATRHNKLIYNANLYKHQALRQQMNPHFIFNTIGSIQYYILNNEPLKSQQYLTKFANLMRKTLDNSRQAAITLEEEMEHLKLYLYLEEMRLSGKFTYSIDCPDFDLVKHSMIPTMLMQPFVENSIWHGIMLKQPQEGWVHIDIAKQDYGLKIKIDDNGVGRKQAQQIRENSQHTSHSYHITQQRIGLLSNMYGHSFNIRIIDKIDEQQQPLGTLVEISIPSNFIPHQQ